MRGLDTNVLARFLLRDDEAQFRCADRFVAQAADDGAALRFDVVVLCEFVWVLRAACSATVTFDRKLHASAGFAAI